MARGGPGADGLGDPSMAGQARASLGPRPAAARELLLAAHRQCIAWAGSLKHPGGQISGSGRGGAVLCRVWPAGRSLSIWPRGPDLTQDLAPGPDASICSRSAVSHAGSGRRGQMLRPRPAGQILRSGPAGTILCEIWPGAG
eukprot:COSAG01_NODE_799_length_13501_cov_15.980749_14_plen_142_part_00